MLRHKYLLRQFRDKRVYNQLLISATPWGNKPVPAPPGPSTRPTVELPRPDQLSTWTRDSVLSSLIKGWSPNIIIGQATFQNIYLLQPHFCSWTLSRKKNGNIEIGTSKKRLKIIFKYFFSLIFLNIFVIYKSGCPIVKNIYLLYCTQRTVQYCTMYIHCMSKKAKTVEKA